MAGIRLYDIVKRLLEANEIMRNSDKALMWAVWQRLGFATDTITKEAFLSAECPTPESITRCRRKIQEEYPSLQATKEVQDMRRKKEANKGDFVYNEMVSSKPEYEWVFEGNVARKVLKK